MRWASASISSHCAATGATDDLDLCFAAHPAARCRARRGAAYKERLFALPPFLLGSQNAVPTPADIAAGLKLTGHFLLERVLEPHGREMPPARLRLDALAARESQRESE